MGGFGRSEVGNTSLEADFNKKVQCRHNKKEGNGEEGLGEGNILRNPLGGEEDTKGRMGKKSITVYFVSRDLVEQNTLPKIAASWLRRKKSDKGKGGRVHSWEGYFLFFCNLGVRKSLYHSDVVK